uniref:Putative RNA-directed DNA polymerase from transposon BS n=1 Tax=Lygus hesperus TaxID=30085 RepID=A0A146L204_LYGHE
MLDWLMSYLTDRSLMVRIRNHLSRPFGASSGCPQGSHLGPWLFLIFINEIKEIFNGKIRFLLYADDLKMFLEVSDRNDSELLQENLDRFSEWCLDNRLSLNLSKCHVVSYARGDPVRYDYSIYGQRLERGGQVKDLGVIFDSQLTFNDHIDHVCNRAMKVLGFVKRSTVGFHDVDALTLLYTSLVRSGLEYCSVVWSPFYTCSKSRIERVQNNFLRFLSYRTGVATRELGYGSLREASGLMALEARRQWFDTIFVAKLFTGAIDSPPLLSIFSLRVPGRDLRSQLIFSVPFTPTNYLLNSPIVRMQRNFNHLSDTIKDLDLFFTSFVNIKSSSRKLLCM